MGSSGICHRWPKNKAELETPCNLKWGRKNLLNWEPGDGGWNPPYWHLLTCDLGQLTASIDKGLSHPRGNSTIPHAVGKSLHYLSSIPWTSHCSLPLPLLSTPAGTWSLCLCTGCFLPPECPFQPILWVFKPFPSKLNPQDSTKLESSWILSVWNNLILQLLYHSICDEIWFFLSHILVIWSIFVNTPFH